MTAEHRQRTWRVGLLVLLLVCWLAAACGYQVKEGVGPPAKLTNLQGIEQLRAAFNQSAGEARLVVFFSPT